MSGGTILASIVLVESESLLSVYLDPFFIIHNIFIYSQGSPSDEKWGETGGDSPPTKEKLQKSPPISPH